jgi:hypothetical protein
MSTEVFEWKSPGRGPHYRVSIDDSSIVLERNGHALSIDLDEIARIHLQPMYALPTTHMLHVEIIDTTGKGVAFHDSGYGPPDADAHACRMAAIALLRRIVSRQSDVQIYEVTRPDKAGRFLVAGTILLVLVGLLWAFIAYVLGQPDRAQGLAIVLSICFVFGTLWSFRKAKRQPPIPADSMLAKLENLRR